MGINFCFTLSSLSNEMGRICRFEASSSSSIGCKIVAINGILMLDYINDTAYVSLII